MSCWPHRLIAGRKDQVAGHILLVLVTYNKFAGHNPEFLVINAERTYSSPLDLLLLGHPLRQPLENAPPD